MRKGLFFVVSAPSGTGKTTLCTRVLESIDNLKFTVSTTTRQPRPNEVNGIQYHFVSEEKFEAMRVANDFAEYANVYGNWYGTSKEELESNRELGKDLLVEIDVQGARALKSIYPDAVLIFIHPPSFEDLRRRLLSRATDTEEVIMRRLSIAAQELAEMPHYDYLIENQILDAAVTDLKSIIIAERRRCSRVLPEIARRFPGTL